MRDMHQGLPGWGGQKALWAGGWLDLLSKGSILGGAQRLGACAEVWGAVRVNLT